MLHITPRTLILMLHIRQSIYLVLKNVLPTSFLIFYITFNEISTTLSIQFWDKCWYPQHMWNNNMFILWNWISSIFYKGRECYLHILPKQHSWLRNVFLKLFQDWLSSVQKHQENFERDSGQKMFILWGGKQMKDWK